MHLFKAGELADCAHAQTEEAPQASRSVRLCPATFLWPRSVVCSWVRAWVQMVAAERRIVSRCAAARCRRRTRIEWHGMRSVCREVAADDVAEPGRRHRGRRGR